MNQASNGIGHYPAEQLPKSMGYKFKVNAGINSDAFQGGYIIDHGRRQSGLGAEGYELVVATNSIGFTGTSSRAVKARDWNYF